MTFKNSLVLLLFLATSMLAFNACNKDDDEAADMAEVAFNIDFLVNGAAFTPGQVYDINGTMVSFETVNFYLGDMTFTPQSGTATAFSGDHLLITPDAGNQTIGDVSTGTFNELSFFVGVAQDANNQTEEDFTNRKDPDPLAEQTPSMHWSWNSGYKFIRIDGSVDTDGDGTPETGMQFHLGNNDRRATITFQADYNLDKGANVITFEFDVAKMFTNIDLSTNVSFHTTPTETATADTFVGNLANALVLKL